MALTEQQVVFFQTFGYLLFPGLLAEEIDWITEEFEEVFRRHPYGRHDGTRRTCIVPFIDQSERLCTLLDHPQIVEMASSLLGEDFNYLGGDGNYYVGDTPWHSDGWHDVGLYIKVALYLDPLTRDTGCLRVIPGTHLLHCPWAQEARKVTCSLEAFGISGREVPCVALETKPGDVVVFNHNLLHASFGGGSARRMFTLNLCRYARTKEELEDLRAFIIAQGRFWIEHMHSELMKCTASPERMRHLLQVIENEGPLAEAARRARETMPAPANG